ncbi:hypothetical protein ALO_09564 [Acetonema longum DSM 6540]|uniref:Uncharacterized protein n=1 Tax=Acetonema longum DSM 6540 TaxID=1009370 RepID=F7NIL0_9FIRM|nr:hypothetical protein ALO_09564 [Acetonema longum DSM 6540]
MQMGLFQRSPNRGIIYKGPGNRKVYIKGEYI